MSEDLHTSERSMLVSKSTTSQHNTVQMKTPHDKGIDIIMTIENVQCAATGSRPSGRRYVCVCARGVQCTPRVSEWGWQYVLPVLAAASLTRGPANLSLSRDRDPVVEL